jgi:hypothetical protein
MGGGEVMGRVIFNLILRKSGKMSNIKIAEIWEKLRKYGKKLWKSGKKVKYQKCGNMGK